MRSVCNAHLVEYLAEKVLSMGQESQSLAILKE